MALGTVLHELSRVRDRSVEGLSGLNPDRIDWTERIVFEAKGGAGAVDAVSDQTALYAVILTAATGREWRAATHLIRQKRERHCVCRLGSAPASSLCRTACGLPGLLLSASLLELTQWRPCSSPKTRNWSVVIRQ
jgi:hypothetical protein